VAKVESGWRAWSANASNCPQGQWKLETIRQILQLSIMLKKDPRVDAYIAKSADFAKPILTHIRKLVHAACPDVTETIKWSTPFYEHKGILIATPAFKHHCALVFWKGSLVFKEFLAKDNPRKKLRRLTSAADLPSDKLLTGYIKKAVELNEAGIKIPTSAKPKAKKGIVMPDYFLAALKKNKKTLAAFENFSPSCKSEYVEWITEAKREETRAKRIQTAIEWIAKGKSRHWKYQ
jgi:uncharacterized protein YdeI (YjbR/CyaY-like superfamily)